MGCLAAWAAWDAWNNGIVGMLAWNTLRSLACGHTNEQIQLSIAWLAKVLVCLPYALVAASQLLTEIGVEGTSRRPI